MNDKDVFIGELSADCSKAKPRNIPLNEYILTQFLQGKNCNLCDITPTEHRLLVKLSNRWLIQTPITDLKLNRAYYDKLIESYRCQPMLYAALTAAKDNLKLNFFSVETITYCKETANERNQKVV